MSLTSRLCLGFLAGLLSHLIFQGGFGASLYAVHLLPALPWSLTSVPPLGVPKTLSLGFWAGLWGLAYALLERRLTARFGLWLGGFVFGLGPAGRALVCRAAAEGHGHRWRLPSRDDADRNRISRGFRHRRGDHLSLRPRLRPTDDRASPGALNG